MENADSHQYAEPNMVNTKIAKFWRLGNFPIVTILVQKVTGSQPGFFKATLSWLLKFSANPSKKATWWWLWLPLVCCRRVRKVNICFCDVTLDDLSLFSEHCYTTVQSKTAVTTLQLKLRKRASKFVFTKPVNVTCLCAKQLILKASSSQKSISLLIKLQIAQDMDCDITNICKLNTWTNPDPIFNFYKCNMNLNFNVSYATF